MHDTPVLVGHRPVVHLATNTVVGWRFGRTRTPADPGARADHLRRAVEQMARTLLEIDGSHRSMRFALIEADVDEAAELVDPLTRVIADHQLPGPRFGIVFPGADVASRTDRHDLLRRLVGLGVGVGYDCTDLSDAFDAIHAGHPITRLRLRVPARDDGVVDAGRLPQLAAIVEFARRLGIRTSITGVDSPAHETIARWAGADVGTGDQLGPVCEVPVREVRPPGGTLASVQRLTEAVHGRRDHAWASAGN